MSIISILPGDLLITIARYLAKEPKDLARLGGACKKTQALVKSEIFANLLDCCQKRSSIVKRITALKDNLGKGLIYQAIVRKTEISQAVSDGKSPYADYTKAREEFRALDKECASLIKVNSMNFPIFDSKGSVVYRVDEQIAAEIKKIQEKI